MQKEIFTRIRYLSLYGCGLSAAGRPFFGSLQIDVGTESFVKSPKDRAGELLIFARI
jgi:hypothetical protein